MYEKLLCGIVSLKLSKPYNYKIFRGLKKERGGYVQGWGY